mmetsp:Transcript_23907/g.28748  ORF Transcript_23907/g.28748 Transcript_23907/m.28748 type:complete len:545 (-) Transcript_23907:200-1834(-)
MARRLAAEEEDAYRAEQLAQEEADRRFAQSMAQQGLGEESGGYESNMMPPPLSTDQGRPNIEFFGKNCVEDLTIEEMKLVIMQAEMRSDDCFEKSELVQRCKLAWALLAMAMSGGSMSSPQIQQSESTSAQFAEFFMSQQRSGPWMPIELHRMHKVDDVVQIARKANMLDITSMLTSEAAAWNASEPFRISDKELETFKAGYLDFLSCYLESEERSKSNEIGALLDESPGTAWVILGYLEYPFCVFAARKFHHTDKKSAPQLKTMTQFGQYPLGTIVERIAKWENVLHWCRNILIQNSQPDGVIAACFRLLAAAATGTTQPKKRVKRCLLKIESKEKDREIHNFNMYQKAFQALAIDISNILHARPLLSPDILLYGLQLPVIAVAAIDASLLGSIQLVPPNYQPGIQSALAKIRDTVEDLFYFELEAHLLARDDMTKIAAFDATLAEGRRPPPTDDNDECKSSSKPEQKSVDHQPNTWQLSANRITRQCDNPGCTKMGQKKCVCKLVSYCGTECQKAHWKEHKRECTRKNNKTKEQQEVATSPI